jgi:hypothetical protein
MGLVTNWGFRDSRHFLITLLGVKSTDLLQTFQAPKGLWFCEDIIFSSRMWWHMWRQKDFSFDCVHHKFNKHTMWITLLAGTMFNSLHLHGSVWLRSNGCWLYLWRIWLHDNDLFLKFSKVLEKLFRWDFWTWLATWYNFGGQRLWLAFLLASDKKQEKGDWWLDEGEWEAKSELGEERNGSGWLFAIGYELNVKMRMDFYVWANGV